MASNFHNILGFLAVGLDFHKGLQVAVPPCVAGVPIAEFPFWEVVCAHPFFMGPNQKPSVKINGVSSVVDGHEPLLLWPHLSWVPLNAFWPLDLLFGSHACWLPRGTVLICDEVSTCTVYEAVTVTLDCWDPCKVPSNLTLQFGTVKTTPSPSDFLFGALRAVVDAAVDQLFDKAFKKIGKAWTPSNKLAVRLTRKGKGYQLAKKLGSRFTDKYSSTLTQRGAAGLSKSVGRRITGELLKRAGLEAKSLVKTGLSAAGFDPTSMLPQSVGNPEAGASQPFKGWPGVGAIADKNVPLYGGVHGIIQAIGG